MTEIEKIKLLNRIIKTEIIIDRTDKKIKKIQEERAKIFNDYYDVKLRLLWKNEAKAKEYYDLLHKMNFLKSKAGDLSIICGKLQTQLIEAGASDVL